MGTDIVTKSRADKIRELLAKGYTMKEIADHLSKGDPRKAKSIRTQLRMMLKQDEKTQTILGLISQGALIEHTPEMVEALIRRAVKGNVPAIKLALEASGFYNPRIQHEHSGDIQITVKSLPRPTVIDDSIESTSVEDADVVS